MRSALFRIGQKLRREGWSAAAASAFHRLLMRVYHTVLCNLAGFLAWPYCLLFGIRFLDVFTRRIGHLCFELDCYIKEGILGSHPPYRALMLAPRGRVANEHLLSYWNRYLRIITSPLLCSLLKPLAANRFTTHSVHRYVSPINRAADFPAIQEGYARTGGRPLLSLSGTDSRRGWEWLQAYGVPRDAWFVCVHCREEGYMPGEGQTYRNAEIASYLPAMEALVERGGWVIRLGDPSMKQLPDHRRIIDYAHLENRSDWLDVFLCASCTFFLGSASGLSAIGNTFGIPAAIANQAPFSVVLPYLPEDLGIPKLLYSLEKQRLLTFREILGSPAGNFRFDSLYQEARIRVTDNTAEEIRALALEMLDRRDGKAVYTGEDERLQERFRSLMNPSHYSYRSTARVGREFLRKYAFLLDP
jgi:putative glycosyltransferase (TIGR04372 family)